MSGTFHRALNKPYVNILEIGYLQDFNIGILALYTTIYIEGHKRYCYSLHVAVIKIQ